MPKLLMKIITLLLSTAVAAESLAGASVSASNNLPSYCYPDHKDFGCFGLGVPHCCVWDNTDDDVPPCPDVKPRCDIGRHSNRLRRVPIGPNDYCNAEYDVCADGYSCVDGVCREIIYKRAYTPRTRAPIRAGRVCQIARGDICEDGYSCTNGRCAIPPIGRNGLCRYGYDVCGEGLDCIDGICQTFCHPATHPGGDCTTTHCCTPGYSCQPSRLNGSDRWDCYSGVDQPISIQRQVQLKEE